jgi:hypothetical protein
MAKPPTPDANLANGPDPRDWGTGDEPISPAQRAQLEALYTQAGEDIPEDLDELTRAEATLEIEELQRLARGPSAPRSAH